MRLEVVMNIPVRDARIWKKGSTASAGNDLVSSGLRVPRVKLPNVVSSIGLSQLLAVLICSAAKGVAMDYQDGH